MNALPPMLLGEKPTLRINGQDQVLLDWTYRRDATRDQQALPEGWFLPDPRWLHIDGAGHVHAWAAPDLIVHDQMEPWLPTLAQATTHHDCDRKHCASYLPSYGVLVEPPNSCAGWDETSYTCRLCAEPVQPEWIDTGQLKLGDVVLVESTGEFTGSVLADQEPAWLGAARAAVIQVGVELIPDEETPGESVAGAWFGQLEIGPADIDLDGALIAFRLRGELWPRLAFTDLPEVTH